MSNDILPIIYKYLQKALATERILTKDGYISEVLRMIEITFKKRGY